MAIAAVGQPGQQCAARAGIRRRTPLRSSHGPRSPAAATPTAPSTDDRDGRRHQGAQPLGALVDEVRDQVALHRRQRHQQRRAGQRHREDHHAARRAEVPRRRLQQHRKAHDQDRARARRGDRVRRAAQERRRRCLGSAAAAAARVDGEASSRISQASRAGDGRPQIADEAPADAGRSSRRPPPGCRRRSPSARRTASTGRRPASMPSSVACRQNPASPDAQQRDAEPLRLDEDVPRPQRRASPR